MVVLGDLNAHVGRNVTVWGDVIGKQDEIVENGNGRRLLQFCAENDLVLANSCMVSTHSSISISSRGNVEGGISDPL